MNEYEQREKRFEESKTMRMWYCPCGMNKSHHRKSEEHRQAMENLNLTADGEPLVKSG